MKNTLIFIILAFIFIETYSLSQDNIVIGVYTQKYFYGDHNPIDGSILTYLAPTYVNIASITGAKVVPIYSYTPQKQIISQISKVNGVIFTGGQEYININNTWTKNALAILQYAKKQNQAGRVFPILGICQGLQLMLYLTSDWRADFLDSIYNQNGVWNTLQFQTNNYYLLKGVTDQTFQAITDAKKTPQGGPLYFYHSNGTLLQTFRNDKDLSQFWNLVATTSKGNQTFVTYLEAKNYPFYITQFHPQRLSFSYNLSDALYNSRAELISRIALQFGMKCKQSVHRYAVTELKEDIVDNYPMYDSTRFEYKVYLFNQWQAGKNLRNDKVITSSNDLTFLIIWGIVIICGIIYWFVSRKRSSESQDRGQNRTFIQQRNRFGELNQNSSRT